MYVPRLSGIGLYPVQAAPSEAALSRKRPRRELPAENSRRREGSGRSAPGDRWAPLACAPTAARLRRSHSTTPFRIGRARNPGAGTRGPNALGDWPPWRTDVQPTELVRRRLPLDGGRAPLRGSPVSHWLPAVSLGTWRRRPSRPSSGWAGGRREPLWSEPSGAKGAGGPLDPLQT